MTEKRFTLIEINGNIEDSCTQSVYDGGEDVFELLDLLNSLDDKNEQLKKQLQKIHKLINSKIQSAREVGSVRTVIALKNLQRQLKGGND